MGFEPSDRLIYGFSQDGGRLVNEPFSRKSVMAERSGAYSINDCLGVSLIGYGAIVKRVTFQNFTFQENRANIKADKSQVLNAAISSLHCHYARYRV